MNEVLNYFGNLYINSGSVIWWIYHILSILMIYKTFYLLIGLLFTRKFKKAKKNHKYGIVIAARNEEAVIGNLLDSINKQEYPKNLINVFVVADNCTDNTASISKKYGAIVYERKDEIHKTKGYALEYLFDKIESDYGRDSFEGYFVFDADNLLEKNYISKMNDAFDSGVKIVTSYRNTKNLDDSFVSSTYAIHWLRSVRTSHRARSILRLATNIQGTGFLFSSELVKNGWKYTSLTEDRAFTADAVKEGYEISYQDEAIFYDEQPTNLKIALRQRLRWSKGHLQAFIETGPGLFVNIFCGKLFRKNKQNVKKGMLFKIVESVRHRFASFDILMLMIPMPIVYFILWFIFSLLLYSCYSYGYGISDVNILGNDIIINGGYKAFYISILITIYFRLIFLLKNYIKNMWMAIYIFLVENKRIKKIKLYKKLLYIISWPIFDIIGKYTMYIALFKRVEWKTIPHESKVTIDDLKGDKNV